MSATHRDTHPRLGFVLVQQDVKLPWLSGRQYRGIDRLPFVPNPLELENTRLANIWKEYLDAWELGRLGRRYSIAEEARRRFLEVGESTEIVYAEIVVGPDASSATLSEESATQRARSLAWLDSRIADVEEPPMGFTPIGYDVSTPIPSFHSALVQPGLVCQDSSLAIRLNDFGLITDDLEYATELMEAANRTGYLLSTFCVIRVLAPRRTD